MVSKEAEMISNERQENALSSSSAAKRSVKSQQLEERENVNLSLRSEQEGRQRSG
jgi:hypothetical protein